MTEGEAMLLAKMVKAGALLSASLMLSACSFLPAEDTNGSTPAPSTESATTEPSPYGSVSQRTFEPDDISDSGPREGASGEAKQDENGYWYYKVVSGDVGGIICDRFGRKWWQLETSDRQAGFDCYTMVYPGQIVIPTSYEKTEVGATSWVPQNNPFD